MILPTLSFCVISTPYSKCDFDFCFKTNRQTSRDAAMSNIDSAQVVQIEQWSKLGQAPLPTLKISLRLYAYKGGF